MPTVDANNSVASCCRVATPDVAYPSLSGLAFAQATYSAGVFAGKLGFTTRTLGFDEARVMWVKSLTGS